MIYGISSTLTVEFLEKWFHPLHWMASSQAYTNLDTASGMQPTVGSPTIIAEPCTWSTSKFLNHNLIIYLA